MTDQQPHPEMDDEYLRFLLEEELDLLAIFRSICDRDKRIIIVELAKAVADTQKIKWRHPLGRSALSMRSFISSRLKPKRLPFTITCKRVWSPGAKNAPL